MNRLFLFLLLFSTNTAFSQITWEPLNGPNGNDIKGFAIDQNGNYHLRKESFVDSYWISRDSGQTWQPSTIFVRSQYEFNGFFMGVDGLLYIVEKDNIMRWDGTTWSNVFSESFPETIIDANLTYANKFIIVTGTGIYSSDYEGSFIEKKIIRPFNRDIEISINPSGKHYLILSSNQSSIIEFYDNLRSFSNLVFNPISSSRLINSFLPIPSGEIIVGLRHGVLVSKDEGNSWKAKSLTQGASNQQPSVLEVFYLSGKIYAITHNEIFVSDDKGNSWAKHSSFDRDFYGARAIKLINFDNTVYAYSDINCSSVFKSKNQLLTWEPIEFGFKNPDVNYIYKSRISETLYAKSCENKYRYSKTSGENWTQINYPDAINGYDKLTFTDSSKIFTAKYQSNEILRTTDFGNNWELVSGALDSVSTGIFRLNYNPVRKEIWAISYNDPTFFSLDYGETWLNSLMPREHQPWHLFFLENGVSYSFNFDYSEAFVRKNNSTTWESIKTPTVDSAINIKSLSPLKNGSYYILTQEGIISNENFTIYQFYPDSELLEKRFYSEDELQLFVTKNGELLSWDSNTSSLQISYDVGLNWESIKAGLPNRWINTIYEDYEGFLYLGLEGEVIYKSSKPVSNTQELNGETLFTVFPNPTFSDVTIHSVSNENVVSVFNIWGEKVMERKFEINQFSIPISHLPKGTYILSLKDEKGNIQSKKLMKL